MSEKHTIPEFQIDPIESGMPLQDFAADFVAELYNARITRSMFGIELDASRHAEGPDGTIAAEPEIALSGLVSLLSRVYLAGRADQIHDMESDNAPRTVKARELPGVIRDAATFYPSEEAQSVANVVDVFKHYRGALLAGAVEFQGLSEEEANVLRKIAEEDRLALVIGNLPGFHGESQSGAEALNG